ncbi:MAG: ParB/RepB/Spo0J family partition protein [Candidatus Komeilibacteria bacterium]|nr:ParB/RepB/Spo0J family partition protein [Candidatus Komeilibacteria bacterium]
MINKSLGRGLGSLIQSSGPAQPMMADSESQKISPDSISTGDLVRIPIDKLTKNPYQPRLNFSHEELEGLADSIKKFGILEPLLVVKKDDGYQLIAGERRLQAAILVGLETVPVIVKEADDMAMMEISLIENLQREDLDPIEEALAYQRFMKEFQLTQEQVAERVHKKRSTVANAMRLLQLPEEIRETVKLGRISRGQAKLILSVADEKYQRRLFRKIMKDGLTVQQTSRAVSDYRRPVVAGSDVQIQELENRLRSRLSTRVKLNGSLERGEISIHYDSAQDLRRIIEELGA